MQFFCWFLPGVKWVSSAVRLPSSWPSVRSRGCPWSSPHLPLSFSSLEAPAAPCPGWVGTVGTPGAPCCVPPQVWGPRQPAASFPPSFLCLISCVASRVFLACNGEGLRGAECLCLGRAGVCILLVFRCQAQGSSLASQLCLNLVPVPMLRGSG